MALSCRPAQDSTPQAPLGGDLSRPMPYADVLGFARLQPEGLLWRQVAGLLPQTENLAQGTGVEPLVQLLHLYQDPAVLEEGSPLVVLFLDATVHGFPFGLAVRERAGAVEAKARGSERVQWSADGRELRLTRRATSGAMGTAMTFLDTAIVGPVRHAGEDELPTPVVYHRFEEDGFQLILPARDGRRNARAVLQGGRLFDLLPAAEYLQVDLQRVLGGLRQAVDLLLRSRFFQPRVFRRGNGEVHYWGGDWRLRRRFVDLATGSLGEFQRLDYLCEGEQHQAYLTVADDGLLARAGRAMPVRAREELLAGVPQGTGVVAVSLDGHGLLQVQQELARVLGRWSNAVEAPPLERGWWSLELVPEPMARAFLGDSEGAEPGALAGSLGPWVRWWNEGLADLFRDGPPEGSGPQADDGGDPSGLGALLGFAPEPVPGGLLISAEQDPARRQRLLRQAASQDPQPWARSVPWPEQASALFRVDLGLVRLAGSLRADPQGFLVAVGPGR